MFDLFKATPLPDHHTRDARQSEAFAWAGRTFGNINLDKRERARRFLEEAVELGQACGLAGNDCLAIMDHVYTKPPGEVFQEAGGVGITLLMLCEAFGVSADGAERAELARVQSIPAEYFRERHNRKADAGVAARIS